MVDLLEFRVNKFIRMSDHCRRLANDLAPMAVSNEIAAVADDLDREVVRMRRDCVGSRICPCKFSGVCFSTDGADPLAEILGLRQVA